MSGMSYATKRRLVLTVYRRALRNMGVPQFVIRELRTLSALRCFAIHVASAEVFHK